MTSRADFLADLPVADISISRSGKQHIRIYAMTEEEIGLPLVDVRLNCRELIGSLQLTVEQADNIGEALLAAAKKARGDNDL